MALRTSMALSMRRRHHYDASGHSKRCLLGLTFACRRESVIDQAQNQLDNFQVPVENRMTQRLSSDILP
jgi:hypothetical protein